MQPPTVCVCVVIFVKLLLNFLSSGAAIFVTTILIGVIAAIKPFKASERPFLRDIIFYIGAVYWGFYMLWRGKVYLWECIGKLLITFTFNMISFLIGHRSLYLDWKLIM